MLSLFAYRAAHPKELLSVNDPIGPDNDELLASSVNDVDIIIAAWGAETIAPKRSRDVMRLLAAALSIASG